MAEIPLFQVDSFTTVPFAGNPAGVCLLEKPMPEVWMKSLAREMNLSETAFLVPKGEGFHLRWFTPTVEVSLCGHATLASAHILWEQGFLPVSRLAVFETLSGTLTCRREDGWIVMDFPAREVIEAPAPEGMLEALGLNAVLEIRRYKEKEIYLIEIADETVLRELNPDANMLLRAKVRGAVVTCCSTDSRYDFISRFFAPGMGVNEDPVTGSTHCALAPYWGRKLGKTRMTAYQASARGGEIRVELAGERVILRGQAVTVFAANINPMAVPEGV